MVQDTLPPPSGVATSTAITGEVIDPADLLKSNEQNIRKSFRKMEGVVESVARSLNIIYHNNLWHLHKTAEGKRRYTNFNDYLETEFGWDKSGARARQIMKADQEAAIAAGAIPAKIGDKRRERSAPEITATKAAKVTLKQATTFIEAFATRLDNTEAGEGYRRLSEIYEMANESINGILTELDTLINDLEAEADVAEQAADEEGNETDNEAILRLDSSGPMVGDDTEDTEDK